MIWTIILLVLLVLVVLFIIIIYFQPLNFVDWFNKAFDEYFGSSYDISLQTKDALGFNNLMQANLDALEMRYRYLLHNAGINRVVIVVTSKDANVFMNQQLLNEILETTANNKSIVGYSNANSGTEVVEVIGDSKLTEPRVYISSNSDTLKVVDVTDNVDLLQDI